MVEKALFISGRKDLGRVREYDRIYFGSEFCQHLIPRLDELKDVRARVQREGRELTLVTPYVTEDGLKRLGPLFRFLENAGGGEVVFNEWGVFKLLRDRYPRLVPVVGRLLTKQRRDPAAFPVLFNTQVPRMRRGQDGAGAAVYLPRKLPGAVLEHFRGSVVNVPVFREFLRSNGVRRVELDLLPWDMKIETGPEMLVSLYLPYGYVTTTRLCGLVNLSYERCRKRCVAQYLRVTNDDWPMPFYVSGNTVFYKMKHPPARYVREKGISRIVYQELGF